MFEWIAENAATVIAASAVLICAGLAVFSLIKEKKSGKGCSSCGGNCAACGMCRSGGKNTDRSLTAANPGAGACLPPVSGSRNGNRR